MESFDNKKNLRREKDLKKLCQSSFEVTSDDKSNEIIVKFYGPDDSPYFGGQWKVRVTLPDQYPFKSPSIGFVNKIFHPNIDERSGSVCLDVINQTWSPMFDLLNVFQIFLPQLLLYPNPKDPLNPEAARLLMKDEQGYHEKVKQYIEKYAQNQIPEDQNHQNSDQKKQRSQINSQINLNLQKCVQNNLLINSNIQQEPSKSKQTLIGISKVDGLSETSDIKHIQSDEESEFSINKSELESVNSNKITKTESKKRVRFQDGDDSEIEQRNTRQKLE